MAKQFHAKYGLLAGGMAAYGLAFVLDLLYWKRSILQEGPPVFSFGQWTKSVILLIATIFMVWSFGVYPGKRDEETLPYSKTVNSLEIPFSAIFALILSVIFCLTFLTFSDVFHFLSVENGPVEVASAILWFETAVLFGWLFVSKSYKDKIQRYEKILFAILALGCFICGMEEISWGQWLFRFSTPSWMPLNRQHEFNLHNFSTNFFELMIYSGSFFILVLLPFLMWIRSERKKEDSWWKIFIPRSDVFLIGAISTAFTYDMWNNPVIQTCFWASLVILIHLAIHIKTKEIKTTFVGTALVIVALQTIFLVYGNRFDRLWDVTEYREFFIPWGFFIYSISILQNFRKKCPGSSLIKEKSNQFSFKYFLESF